MSIGSFAYPRVNNQRVVCVCIMETFGDWLGAEMRKQHMTQKELAIKSGITSAQISRVLSGMRNPGKAFLISVASALNLPTETILQKAGYPIDATQLDEANYKLDLVSKAGKLKQALDYLDFLLSQEK